MEEASKMIDLHNHILYGRDDGAKTLEESIRMCRIGYQDGVRTIVATPHILPGIYKNDRSTILSKVTELNEAIKKFGINDSVTQLPNDSSRKGDPITQFLNDAAWQGPQSASGLDSAIRNPWPVQSGANFTGPQSAIKILPGADVHFSSDLLERLGKGEIVTVNDQGRFLMVEFEFQGIPYKAEEALFQLMSNGIIPIISHPERNTEIEHRPQRYYEMVRMGCLGQVTAMSLTGEFGPEVKRSAERLLTKRLLHIIASDAHSPNRRPPILSAGVKAAEKIVGKEEARKMVTEYPKALIEGRRPDVPDPISP
jgi:protein-tyrosine phosphatase